MLSQCEEHIQARCRVDPLLAMALYFCFTLKEKSKDEVSPLLVASAFICAFKSKHQYYHVNISLVNIL